MLGSIASAESARDIVFLKSETMPKDYLTSADVG